MSPESGHELWSAVRDDRPGQAMDLADRLVAKERYFLRVIGYTAGDNVICLGQAVMVYLCDLADQVSVRFSSSILNIIQGNNPGILDSMTKMK